ncbi:MAG TPA: hypothetical protein VHH36_03680 [Candidatus Thermoplasmatota archaeon]|nr:hypothetical protein [Candidatus Thermoplasmatota archaeon]
MSNRAADPLAEVLSHPLALVFLGAVGLCVALVAGVWWWARRGDG